MFRLSVHNAVLIATLAMFTASASAEMPSLRGSQIKRIFPGDFVVVWKGRHTLSVRARRGGAMTADYGAASLTGKWRVKGNKLCVSVNLWIGTKKTLRHHSPQRRVVCWHVPQERQTKVEIPSSVNPAGQGS